MLMAMARDVRVILIKLADRLHNMRTLDSVSQEKSERIARETMDIYAPIANRLGLNNVYQELEDLSFKYLHPNRYAVLSKALKVARGNRREVVSKILEAIRQRLDENHIKAEVRGREKHLYGIYQKMQSKSLAFAQVLDIYGFRVLVEDVPSCYLALGVLHSLYKPFPGRFKDYIAIPKANGYQSLHTALFGPFGTPIEVQIRTQEMNKLAESGVASHWLYKSSRSADQRPAPEDAPVAAKPAGKPRAERRFGRVPGTPESRPVPGRSLCVLAQGQDLRAAARRDRGRFCLQRAHRHRQPLRRRQGEFRTRPAAHRVAQRRPRRDHHRPARAPQPGLAELCRDQQGARRDTPRAEDHASGRIGQARRTPARPGAQLARHQAAGYSRCRAGNAC